MENNNQNNKEEYLLPKEVLTYVNNLIGKGAHTLSTVIETEFYTQEALNRMLEKNEITYISLKERTKILISSIRFVKKNHQTV